MEIENIITLRKMGRWTDYGLVFEWEDIFKEMFQSRFHYERHLFNNRFFNNKPILSHINLPHSCSFAFDMYARLRNSRWNTKHIIPCIIDYYLDDNLVSKWERNYRKNPIVLVSSFQVYCHLKDKNIQLPIAHLPLSLSDKYKITPNTCFNKKYDVILAGRPNKVFELFLSRYIAKHPNLYYVYNKKEPEGFVYYTNKGERLGIFSGHDSYMNLLSKSKVGFYSTPGIDGDEKRVGSHSWNQVTPRLFEYITSGCHVIARYPSNPDTNYFELEKVTLPATDYLSFENSLEKALSHDVDMKMYSNYMSKHYTSVRVKQFKEIIKML